jgi:hypothetical protein
MARTINVVHAKEAYLSAIQVCPLELVVAFTATIMLAGIAPASATSTCPSKRVGGSRMSLGEFVKTGAPNPQFFSRWCFFR